MEWPKLKRDYKGLLVRTKATIENGRMEIPEGTVCEVRDWYQGLTLKSEPCSKCGVRVSISRVPLSDVELIGPAS